MRTRRTLPMQLTMTESRPRRPYALATSGLFLGFAAVWGLAHLGFGLGTCGEDSEIIAEAYARLCDPGGRIVDNLLIIGGAAVAVTVGLGAAAIRRRAARPVLLLAGLLTVADAAILSADRL